MVGSSSRTVQVALLVTLWWQPTVGNPAVASEATGEGNSTVWARHLQHPQLLMDSEAFVQAMDERNRNRNRNRRGDREQTREPRFISFETKDNNIEVEIDFAIPFLTIPVKKSMNGMMGSLVKGTPLLNLNVGAVILAGVLALGGALLGAAARMFNGNTLSTPLGPLHLQRAENRRDHGSTENPFWELLAKVDKTLQKLDIDTAACTQRMVCWHVKDAMVNVRQQQATSLDTIVNGLSEADWARKFTVGTAIEDAIQAGRRQANCAQTFTDCRLNDGFVRQMLDKIRHNQ